MTDPEAPPKRMALLVFLIVVAIGFACVLALTSYYSGKRAEVGAVCNAQYGCVDGADCRLLEGTLRPGEEGVCRRRCSADSECGQGEGCSRHCVPMANIGGRCGSQILCPANASCIDDVCREECQGACKKGFECSIVPLALGADTTRHCLPEK